MRVVKNAGQAIKIAKQVITEAGYTVAQITEVDFSDEDVVKVTAFSGDIGIELEIDVRTGEVMNFSASE